MEYLIVIIINCILLLATVSLLLVWIKKMANRDIENERERQAQLEYRIHAELPDVTKKYIDFVREFSIDHTTVAFYQFTRTTNIDKSNKSIVEKFISGVCNDIREYLGLKDGGYDKYSNILITPEYVDGIIVDSVIHVTTQMLEKYVEEGGGIVI